MKDISNLARNLRVFFGLARLLTLLAGAGLLLNCFLLSQGFAESRIDGFFGLVEKQVLLRVSPGTIGMKTPSARPDDLRVERLTASVNMNLNSADPELASALRWTLLPQAALEIAFYALLFGFLHHLCRRLELGEIFSTANFRAVQNLGRLLVVFEIASWGLSIWSAYRLGDYLDAHVTVTGIKAGLSTSAVRFSLLPSAPLLAGLLILLLAEAFRQGLALKKENDLTV